MPNGQDSGLEVAADRQQAGIGGDATAAEQMRQAMPARPDAPPAGAETYRDSNAAMSQTTEAILDLSRSQDPRRTATRVRQDLELAEAHLDSAIRLVRRALAGLA